MKSTSIKNRAIYTSIGIALGMIILLAVIILVVMIEGFKKLEQEDGMQNIKRANESYNFIIENYEKKIIDWAEWDDTYKFIDDLNEEYIESNLVAETLSNIHVDEILFFDLQGKLKYAVATPEIVAKESNDFPEDVKDLLVGNMAMFDELKSNNISSGLIKTKNGILLYSAHAILKSDGSGVPNGHMLFGRYMDDWITEDMSNMVQLPISIHTNNSDKASKDIPLDVEGNYLYGHYWIPIVNSSDDIVFHLKMNRSVWNTGVKNTSYLLISIIVIAFICAIGNYLVLYRFVLDDLLRFKDEVDEISKNNGEGGIKEYGSGLEINELRDNVNKLLTIINNSRFEEKKRSDELDRMNKLMIGRENKMIELKNTIADLKKKII